MRATNRQVREAASGARTVKRAVLYLRVSTPSQVNTDYNPEGISIPAQREAGERKANELKAKVVNEFVEPGRTATSVDKRPVFQEMIAWVKAQGDIDYIIVYHFNRIFRNSIDAAITKRELGKLSVRVVSTVLDMGETPESQMVETIIHAVDQYSHRPAARTSPTRWARKLRTAAPSPRPKSATSTSESRSTAAKSAPSPSVRSAPRSCSKPSSCTPLATTPESRCIKSSQPPV